MESGKTMTLRLTEDMANELEFVARVRGIPISQAVRIAVGRYLSALSEDEAFQARLRSAMQEEQQTLERMVRRAGPASLSESAAIA